MGVAELHSPSAVPGGGNSSPIVSGSTQTIACPLCPVTHVHRRTEHCLVVSGDFRVAGRTLEAGDYHRAQAGSTHEAVGSVGGCLVLVVEVQA